MPAPRIGAVSYLNSKPLIEGLSELAPDAELRLDYPSRLADDLSRGRLDVALIPSVEFFRGRDYEVVSDACVAARGPVLSVKLYSRVPLGAIRRLALDEGSRTSAALVQIMLAERYGVVPQREPLPLGRSFAETTADAVLLIGDRAIHPPTEEFVATWDLGEEWFRWTGLPFVFAMWVARSSAEWESNHNEPRPTASPSSAQALIGPSVRRQESDGRTDDGQAVGLGDFPSRTARRSTLRTPRSAMSGILSQARDLGVSRLEAIARREAPLLGLTEATTIHYLTRNLHYHLGSAERSGLKLFYRLAVRHGFAPEGRDLVFHTGLSAR